MSYNSNSNNERKLTGEEKAAVGGATFVGLSPIVGGILGCSIAFVDACFLGGLATLAVAALIKGKDDDQG